MKKHQLAQLTDLAQNRTHSATQSLGQSHAREREAEGKLALLRKYRQEYQQRLTEVARNGLAPDALRNYHEFLRKLDAAIEQQTAVLMNCQAGVAASKTAWEAANRKLKSYSTLGERQRATEQKDSTRREQRDQDEHTARSRSGRSRGLS